MIKEPPNDNYSPQSEQHVNFIHIFTEVKRQSFSDLAKAIERKRPEYNRKPIIQQGGLWRNGESGYLAIAQSLDEALGLLEECLPSKKRT